MNGVAGLWRLTMAEIVSLCIFSVMVPYFGVHRFWASSIIMGHHQIIPNSGASNNSFTNERMSRGRWSVGHGSGYMTRVHPLDLHARHGNGSCSCSILGIPRLIYSRFVVAAASDMR